MATEGAIMKVQTRIITILMSLFLHFVAVISWAQIENATFDTPLFKTPGMTFFSPQEFYTGKLNPYILSEMPEMTPLMADNHKQTNGLMNFLMGEGVSMGFGVNPNRDSYFDLYGTVSVDVEMDFPAAQFGETPESEGGKRYFPDHDATHLWAVRGVGPRLKDLENREQAINEWVKVLMDAEALATAYNSAYQVRDYWNWRYRQSRQATPSQIAEFEAVNKGVMSSGNWNYGSYLDVVLTNVRGQVLKQYNLLKNNIDYNTFMRARAAGVPELVPPLSDRIGAKGEKYFMKYAFAPLFAITSYLRPKSGYTVLIKATRKLLEYYYSDFYIRWSDKFEIGEDIQTAKNNLDKRLQLFAQDKISKTFRRQHPVDLNLKEFAI